MALKCQRSVNADLKSSDAALELFSVWNTADLSR